MVVFTHKEVIISPLSGWMCPSSRVSLKIVLLILLPVATTSFRGENVFLQSYPLKASQTQVLPLKPTLCCLFSPRGTEVLAAYIVPESWVWVSTPLVPALEAGAGGPEVSLIYRVGSRTVTATETPRKVLSITSLKQQRQARGLSSVLLPSREPSVLHTFKTFAMR